MAYRVKGACNNDVVVPRDRPQLHIARIAEMGRAMEKHVRGLEGRLRGGQVGELDC